jgi:hypothetical protein
MARYGSCAPVTAIPKARGRSGACTSTRLVAVAVSTLGVLAKEPVLLVLAGVALWRRDRAGLALVLVATVALLLIGHGGLGIAGKPELTAHYVALGPMRLRAAADL